MYMLRAYDGFVLREIPFYAAVAFSAEYRESPDRGMRV